MVTVECKECPIRNFCPRQNKIETPIIRMVEVVKQNSHDCPLVKLIEED